MRRSLGVALWTLVGLLACFLGALNALVGTRAGRTMLARVASTVVEGAVHGSIEVGEVRGSLLTGVVLTDVRLLDPDSTLVAWLPRAELGYNPIDFAAGRVVFMEVRLERPIINIVQHANGRTNFDELLRLGEKDTVTVEPLGPAGPSGFTVTVCFSPRRSSSSKLVLPLACCTMLMTGRSSRTSMNTIRPAAKSIGL